ncbi:MAG: hypothetical protein OEY56_10460, partial [Cyclobacteriaceae bacterium]|nr:hypothetical protein [Cyclobacteriaceae bacterium]
YVEIAARFGDLTGQPHEKVRDFFIKYQDRILYGTDFEISSPEGEEDDNPCEYIEANLALQWQYFSSADSILAGPPQLSYPIRTKGLNLPDSVLQKFYSVNALKILQPAN